MGLNNFILTCEKDNDELRKDLNYYKNYANRLQKENKQLKENRDKAIKTLEKGITFCENDSQGDYDICNIAINREKEILNILKEVAK